MLAVMTATAGVFATKLVAIDFYINNPSAGTPHSCDTPVSENCNPGMNVQCTSSNLSSTAPVWFRDNGGACTALLKP